MALDEAELERQRDSIDRIERLLDRAQRDPNIPLGDAVVVNELLAVRQDLLGETVRRGNYVLRTEFEPIKRGVKWLLATGTSTLLLILAWWLGTKG